MRRRCSLSCASTHTSCYAAVGSLDNDGNDQISASVVRAKPDSAAHARNQLSCARGCCCSSDGDDGDDDDEDDDDDDGDGDGP